MTVRTCLAGAVALVALGCGPDGPITATMRSIGLPAYFL